MGCDIHVRLEVKNRDGIWEPCEVYIKNKDYNPKDPDYGDQFEVLDVYHDRDYSLFAALCGVRDYSPGTPKISDPKGLPDDMSEETREYLVDHLDSDGHSHNWNTLSELYEFQKANKIIKHSGLVSEESARALDEEGKTPEIWCQGTTQPGWTFREWEEECDILGGLIESIEIQVKKVAWIWRPEEKADDIRIVYCFDN